jgi:hypothetical protein
MSTSYIASKLLPLCCLLSIVCFYEFYYLFMFNSIKWKDSCHQSTMGNVWPEILSISIISFVLGSVFVSFYLTSCYLIAKKMAFHEHLMLLAWVCGLFLVLNVRIKRASLANPRSGSRSWSLALTLLRNREGTLNSWSWCQAGEWRRLKQSSLCLQRLLREGIGLLTFRM